MNNENKIPIPLNIPKNKDVQFKDVSFVTEMSEYSLKVFIKRIWQQLMVFANVMETRRKDVPNVVDKMMNGVKWTAKDIEDRYQYGICDNFVIQYDTLERIFVLLDSDTKEPISDPVKAVSVSEGKEHAKQMRNV